MTMYRQPVTHHRLGFSVVLFISSSSSAVCYVLKPTKGSASGPIQGPKNLAYCTLNLRRQTRQLRGRSRSRDVGLTPTCSSSGTLRQMVQVINYGGRHTSLDIMATGQS
ncbi:hypothetical protein DENSPDRAFT_830769 [Dentipellis sp. KUC8613]|nr:hypothetical protein DENSPDRAFT_830769 [Dentipellis sp. KUC8613]